MSNTSHLRTLLAAALLLAANAASFAGVNNSVKRQTPQAATMSILDLKQKYWSSDNYSITPIGLTDEGDSIIIRGRVISSDESGNFYKYLAIRDETAPIIIRVNLSSISSIYPYGSEISVNVTGQYIGMYQNLMYIGSYWEELDYPYLIPSKDFAAITDIGDEVEPEYAQPYTIDADVLNTIKDSTEGRQEWQGQLVKINDLTFVSPGTAYASSSEESSYTTQSVYAIDPNGNRITLRFSSYSTFCDRIIPSDTVSVTGILSFYNTSWQIIPCNPDDIVVTGESSGSSITYEGDGMAENPYNVTAAIANQTGSTAWVKGYIVGAMDASNNYTLAVTAPFSVSSNVYIADDPAETATAYMLPVQLVSGTEVRSAVNLADNPGNFNKLLYIEGTLTTYFGQPGLKDPSDCKLEGDDYEYETTTTGSYHKVTSITDGSYILWADNKIGVAFTDGYSYGYIKSTDCTPLSDGTIEASKENLFTFTKQDQGWTIADSHGQYLYQDDSHNSFQLTKSPDTTSDYVYWTISVDADGQFTISNNGTAKIIQYDPAYGTWAAYSTVTGTLPYLYQPADGNTGNNNGTTGDNNDDEDEDDDVISGGTESEPYTVAEAIALGNPGTTAWVKGYIVGSMNSNNSYTFEYNAPFGIASNVYIADDPKETDTEKMMPVQLVSGTEIRSAVNLVDHPGNLGKLIYIEGTLSAYFSQPGLKAPTDWKLEGEDEDDDDEVISGGTESEPYTVAEAIALGSPGTEAWVMGYIVGSMNSNNSYTFEYSAPFGIASNIYIADSASETNTANMLPVQLVSGSDVRAALNLMDNPSNLGHSVAICGTLSNYFSQPGLKAPTDYVLDYEIPEPVEEEETGVSEVVADGGERAAEVYDLQGRRLAAPRRGINIVNGRKVVVR